MAATPATPTNDDSFLLALLALSDVDLHESERLIGKGCPVETAVRIAG
jgi:hypothetical protein